MLESKDRPEWHGIKHDFVEIPTIQRWLGIFQGVYYPCNQGAPLLCKLGICEAKNVKSTKIALMPCHSGPTPFMIHSISQ